MPLQRPKLQSHPVSFVQAEGSAGSEEQQLLGKSQAS